MLRFRMAFKSCRVTLQDAEGIEHSVTVTANTLYEAVALALVALRGKDWIGSVESMRKSVRVEVQDTPVEHSISLQDFHDWVNRTGGGPRDVIMRQRVKEILEGSK